MWKRGGVGRPDAFKNVKRCSKCNRTIKEATLELYKGYCFKCWTAETAEGQAFLKMCQDRRSRR